MANSSLGEIFATLKSYAQKLSDGERTPAEIATALNGWAHESAESVRSKIQDEVESAALKMGFVKRDEFEALAREVASLKKNSQQKSSQQKSSVKKAPIKKSPAKKKTVKR